MSTVQDRLELLIEIQAKGNQALTQLATTTKGLEDAIARLTEGNKKFQDQSDRTNESMTGQIIKGQLLADSILRIAGAVKSYTVEAAQYAARTEQVSVVMDNLARVNGMNVNSVRMLADGIKGLGITTQESRAAINTMIGSQIDLSKALELTRLAQNAAKIAGVSSSEAFQRLIQGISSGEVEILRHMGIQVSFQQAYERAAKAVGKQANELTDLEKIQARTDAVLARSPLIDGSYVASLTTGAGQMQSLTRYTDDLKNALGQGLQPALADVVTGMERLTKFAQENIDQFQQMTAGVTALGVASAVYGATSFIPNPAVRGGIAAAAGVGAYAFMDQDRSQANVDKYQEANRKLEGQKREIERQLQAGLISPEAFKKFTDQFPAYREMLKSRFIEEQAELYKQRQANAAKSSGTTAARTLLGTVFPSLAPSVLPDSAIPDSFNIGGGSTVTRAEIEQAIKTGKAPFDASGLVNRNPLLNTNTNTGGGVDKELLKRHADIVRILDSLNQHGLDPLQRLLADTESKLRDMVAKHGYLTAGEVGDINTRLGQAARRELGRRKVDTDGTPEVDPATKGFMYGQRGASGFALGGVQTQFITDVDSGVNAANIANARQRMLGAMQRAVSFQEQMVKLTAGPGGEVDAINKVAQLREYAVRREFEISERTMQDRARMEANLDQVRKDRLLEFAQMQQKQLEQYRQAAGQIYDAMVSKGFSGIGDFLKGQVQVIGRTVFQNIAVEMFKQARDTMHLGDMIGGQVGKDGKLTPLGRVLQGTPLGVDQTHLAMQSNTDQTKLNTAAIEKNSAIIQGCFGANGTASGSGSSGAASIGDAAGEALEKSGSKLASKLTKVISTTATIGAGVYGVVQGVQQGGVRGALNTTAGVASMASGLIGSGLFGASMAAGPLGGILAGAAAGISLIAGMFGKSREKFDQEQTDTLNKNKYEAPTASNRVSEVSGRDVDYDFTGRLRVANERNTVVQFNVNAMDVKSFLDRSGDIAEALRKELKLANPVGLDIRAAVLG